MESAIRVGLLGLGTIGAGVYKLLDRSRSEIAERVGRPVEVGRVLVREPQKSRGIDLPSGLLTTDASSVVKDSEIDLIVEVMGGVTPAKDHLIAALRERKPVVTANKELLAKHGGELYDEASSHHADLYFEASVAGGIPIIKPLREALAANHIRAIYGIINGTTNYMLTRMARSGETFNAVLEEAKRLGYAEADPTSDIEGYDAAYKLAILASIAFETRIHPDQVHREGIVRIAPEDVRFGEELGYAVKLLALTKQDDDGAVEARVHPTFIPLGHPLSSVGDAFNAIFVEGDAVGELMFYGRGAGEMPTASAVVGDLIDAARNLRLGVNGRVTTPVGDRTVRPIDEVASRYYIRLEVVDRSGVLAAVAEALGTHDVSIESMIQKGRGEDPVDLVFVTHQVRERSVRAALDEIATLPEVRRVANVIRVEGEM